MSGIDGTPRNLVGHHNSERRRRPAKCRKCGGPLDKRAPCPVCSAKLTTKEAAHAAKMADAIKSRRVDLDAVLFHLRAGGHLK